MTNKQRRKAEDIIRSFGNSIQVNDYGLALIRANNIHKISKIKFNWINVYSNTEEPDNHGRWLRKCIVGYTNLNDVDHTKYPLEIGQITKYNKMYLVNFFTAEFTGKRKNAYKKYKDAQKAIENDFYLFKEFINSF